MSERQGAYGKDALLPVKDWARRYADMLDGADEEPRLNELYEAIDEVRKRSWQTGADAYARGFDEGFASADDWIAQNEDAMRDHGWVKDSRDRRDLLDEIAWLHAELHGAELEAEKATELKAENTRLRSCLKDAAENERLTAHEFNQLKEQRNKLWDLLKATCYYCVNAYCEPGDGCPLLIDGRCTLPDRMCEFGVEVDA